MNYGRQSNGPSPVWQERYEVLAATMEAMIDQASKKKGRDDLEIIKNSLLSLRSFTAKMMEYFGQNNHIRPAGFSPDYPFRVITSQLGHDLSLYGQMIYQRVNSGQKVLKALTRADRLANDMLEPARQAGFFQRLTDGASAEADKFQNPIALTYLQKMPSVRVIPYAPVALVAFPYSCISFVRNKQEISVMRDFLAVPHEVGHYVYRNGKFPIDKAGYPSRFLFRTLPYLMRNGDSGIPPDKASWAEDWVEEIFADTYGCRVAGPILALDFQDLLTENYTDTEFLIDDGRHPIPRVRPEIHAATLSEMRLISWETYVRDRWEDKRKAVTTSDQIIRHGEKTSRPAQEAINLLSVVTDRVNKILSGISFDRQWLFDVDDPPPYTSSLLMTATPKDQEAPSHQSFDEKMYSDWEKKGVARKVNRGINPRPPVFNEVKWGEIWEDWRNELIEDFEQSLPSGKNYTANGIELPLPKEQRAWVVLLNAASWTTEGPDGDPPKTT